ncbi:hypothetical protein IFM89_034336 [Coptis chinensis]|uniref:Glycerol-3-phosphate acyltransferase RAM2/GPAT1-8 HAD-like domain-containing protein n=1 Tax=Coptis chinensis TaxID=261450 RepID=A0A835LGG7_9MAGN|nr:hypothetical protein IFM89_034336 [Coptis chinensis]
MLVAFEGGSIIRAFMLLLSYPFLLAMNHEIRLRVKVFITFCGLKLKYMDSVGMAVLPKFYLENLNLQAYEVLASTGRKVLNYRIMEGMYFISFVDGPGLLVKHKALKEFFGDDKPDIGLGSSNSVHDHLFISLCKKQNAAVPLQSKQYMLHSLLAASPWIRHTEKKSVDNNDSSHGGTNMEYA